MQSETSLWKPPQRWFPTRISKQFSFWKTSEILNRRKQRSSQFQFCFGKLRRYRKGELVKPVLKALVIQSISVNPSISLLSIPLVVTMKASVLFLIRWDIFEKIIKSLSFPCCAVSKNTPKLFSHRPQIPQVSFFVCWKFGDGEKIFYECIEDKKERHEFLKTMALQDWMIIFWDENIIKKYSKCVHLLVLAIL